LAWSTANRTKAQDFQYKPLQRKLRLAIKKRLAPLPLERPIQLTANETSTTASTGKQKLLTCGAYQSEAAATGLPIGEGTLYTNVTFKGCDCSNMAACTTAQVAITISSRSGVIYGECPKCKYSYNTGTQLVTIGGPAIFTDGTWGFRDIKSKNLLFQQVGPLNGANAITTIVGTAFY
jgi:hypothetical protein